MKNVRYSSSIISFLPFKNKINKFGIYFLILVQYLVCDVSIEIEQKDKCFSLFKRDLKVQYVPHLEELDKLPNQF